MKKSELTATLRGGAKSAQPNGQGARRVPPEQRAALEALEENMALDWETEKEMFPRVSHMFKNDLRWFLRFNRRYGRQLALAGAMIARRGPHERMLHRKRYPLTMEQLLLRETAAKEALF